MPETWPCLICKGPTNHASSKCRRCRVTACVTCGKPMAGNFMQNHCSKCQQAIRSKRRYQPADEYVRVS